MSEGLAIVMLIIGALGGIAGISLVVGVILNARGKKEKSEKWMRSFGIFFFIVVMLMVVAYIMGAGKDEVNNGFSDTLSGIYDTVKQGGLLEEGLRPDEGEMYVHYIDVGDGEATLVEYKQDGKRKTILIDVGEDKGKEVDNYLKELRVRGVDTIVLTTADSDHIGEVLSVFDGYRVNEVWLASSQAKLPVYGMVHRKVSEKGVNYYEPVTGDVYEDGDFKIEIISPQEGDTGGAGIGMKISFGEVSFLYTGDASVKVENQIVESGVDVSGDVLHIGNHASNTSTSETYVNAVEPKIAIYSAEEDSEYISESVIEKLEARGITVYGTGKDGTVRVNTDGKSYSVSTTGKKERAKEVEVEDIVTPTPQEERSQRGKSDMLSPKSNDDN